MGGELSPGLRASQPGLFNFLFGIFGFPMGLTLCVVAGADLFTSNVMYATIAVCEGRSLPQRCVHQEELLLPCTCRYALVTL